MSTARFRRPPPRGPAALAVLAALAAAAGCARESAAPGTGPAAAQATPATEAPSAPPTAAPSAPAGSSAVPAVPASAPSPAAAAPTPGGASALAAVLAAAAAAPAAPELTLEQMQRRSPSAALVETFNAACAEPARNAVRRAARRLEFTPVAAGGAAALPEGGEAWNGPEEVGGAVLVWDEATSTCELRARGVDLLLVEAAFSRLPQALEEDGASVMRLPPPPAPAGGMRTRQMLLVQPGGFGRPERARVLRLGHHLGARGAEAGADTVTLSARGVSAPR